MNKSYNFETEQSDYAEEYWDEGVDEKDFALLHLTNALEILNNTTGKIGKDADEVAAAIEKVIDKYFQPKE